MSDSTRDAVLDELARAVGLDPATATVVAQPEAGADCVERSYVTDVEWRIGGCSYEQYRGMFAASVQRIGVWADAPRPLDATIVPVLDGVGGELADSRLSLSNPDESGNTVTIQVTAFADLAEDQLAGLADGPLVGWTPRPGTSPSFTGPNGGTWFAFDGVVEYRWGGRW